MDEVEERELATIERCDGCPRRVLHYVHDGVRFHIVPKDWRR